MEIKGKIKLKDDWQPVVFLASLSSPDDLFVASPDFIIAQAFIQPDGTFSLKTESISADLMFYRFYLVRGDNSLVEFNAFNHKNYQHLILNLNSSIEIEGRIEDNQLQIVELSGGSENEAILEFDKRYLEQKQFLTGDISKAKSNFISLEFEVFVREFVKSSPNALVGLYALYHIDNKDTDFLRNSEFYFDFQKELEKQFPGTAYTQDYSDLLNELIGFREFVCEMPGVQPKWKDQLIIAESIFIFLLLIVIVWFFVTQKKNSRNSNGNESQLNLYDSLTSKQQEILQLLGEGKTNKEIAQELFVELSTVKTHINNIYRQLNVGTRKEASAYIRNLKK
jgi:DNA-binding CsgD family transcriptional regulator